jgi:hypothetical protein
MPRKALRESCKKYNKAEITKILGKFFNLG